MATGRLPWELALNAEQYQYLLACDLLGLIPDPMDVGYRIARCFNSDVTPKNFYPDPSFKAPVSDEQERLSSNATEHTPDMRFD